MSETELDDQPVGTHLIFGHPGYPVITKGLDGRWYMRIEVGSSHARVPLMHATILLWCGDCEGQYALY